MNKHQRDMSQNILENYLKFEPRDVTRKSSARLYGEIARKGKNIGKFLTLKRIERGMCGLKQKNISK